MACGDCLVDGNGKGGYEFGRDGGWEGGSLGKFGGGQERKKKGGGVSYSFFFVKIPEKNGYLLHSNKRAF